jgi:hypothetical protein
MFIETSAKAGHNVSDMHVKRTVILTKTCWHLYVGKDAF